MAQIRWFWCLCQWRRHINYSHGGSFNNNARYGIEAVNSTSSTLPIANLWTDQEDYAPGSVVTISGNDNSLNGNNIGFIFGETVLGQVQGPNGYNAYLPGDRQFLWRLVLPDRIMGKRLAIGDYTYTAVGLTSAVSVTGTFTDGQTPELLRLAPKSQPSRGWRLCHL